MSFFVIVLKIYLMLSQIDSSLFEYQEVYYEIDLAALAVEIT